MERITLRSKKYPERTKRVAERIAMILLSRGAWELADETPHPSPRTRQPKAQKPAPSRKYKRRDLRAEE